MQPYFFPYIGYFSLIKQTDRFILFDTVQFIRHGWIERNRILKPNEGWQYISVPLNKYSRDIKIMDICINNTGNWKEKTFRQLEHYKKRAPYYNEALEVIKEALDIDTNSIVKLNENIIKTICKYIGININVEIFSKMNLEIIEANAPDEWALNICKALGNVSEYWNPEGGLDFFDKTKYTSNNIDIKFMRMNLEEYSQRRNAFESGLSIIDVMMFNDSQFINNMLDNFQIL